MYNFTFQVHLSLPLIVIFSKSQVAKEKTDEKQEEKITNGRIQRKDKEDKEKEEEKEEEEEEEKEEEEESWEVLKSATTTDDDRIETNGMVKKIQ